MKRMVILGGGESGTGSAVLAKKQGYEVFLSDAGTLQADYRQLLQTWEISYEEKGHTREKILSADEVIKSPGIPDTAPLVRELKNKGIPVISEIEFAARYTQAKIIAITGSNGKTTTATLTHRLLEEGGMDTGLAGNIGKSFALQVATQDRQWYVLEISSFQLDGTYDFRPHIAAVLNITPDHLDRYDYDVQKYADSKMRITRNQSSDDWLIYCGDDPLTVSRIDALINDWPMHLAPFTRRNRTFKSAYIREGEKGRELVIQEGPQGAQKLILPTDQIPLQGIHNYYNIMASVIAARLAGVSDASILQTVFSFKGVEHRMEPVAEDQGILYINDSKATNVDAARYALESMTRPIIWIAGGTDKGNDYSLLVPLAREKVKTLVCLGKDNRKLADALHGQVPHIYDTGSLNEAMQRVSESAGPGDVVLLSPACASFDLFTNYEDRGRQFKAAVKALTDKKEQL